MAETEHKILQALSGCLLGAMVINRECFPEEVDSDVQQKQKWSASSLMRWPQHQTYYVCPRSHDDLCRDLNAISLQLPDA